MAKDTEHAVKAQAVQAWIIESDAGLYRGRGARVHYTNKLELARIYTTEAVAWSNIGPFDAMRGEHARPVIITLV